MRYSCFRSVLLLALFGIGALFLYGCQSQKNILRQDAPISDETIAEAGIEPDCRTDKLDTAFIDCWREIMQACERTGRSGAAHVIRVGDEYHAYRRC